jgi:hypothetical protein
MTRGIKKVYYNKRYNLEVKVKHLEWDVSIVHCPDNDFTFQVETSQTVLSHYVYNEWAVNLGCTHQMDKDAPLLNSFNEFEERNIYLDDDFSLYINGQSHVSYWHWRIVKIYHITNLNSNLFLIYQLSWTYNIIYIWPYHLFVWYLNNGQLIVVGGFLNLKDSLYKFFDTTRAKTKLTSLVSHTDEWSQTWHEELTK